jgi:hypothetical protein
VVETRSSTESNMRAAKGSLSSAVQRIDPDRSTFQAGRRTTGDLLCHVRPERAVVPIDHNCVQAVAVVTWAVAGAAAVVGWPFCVVFRECCGREQC